MFMPGGVTCRHACTSACNQSINQVEFPVLTDHQCFGTGRSCDAAVVCPRLAQVIIAWEMQHPHAGNHCLQKHLCISACSACVLECRALVQLGINSCETHGQQDKCRCRHIKAIAMCSRHAGPDNTCIDDADDV